jgi:15-cis-phytoene synthase
VEDLAVAYRHCERVTRQRAGNFFYGIRLLPPAKRRAMCAVYAFAREVDDVGDGDLPSESKLTALDGIHGRLHSSNGAVRQPMNVALDDAIERFDLPVDALEDLIEGVRMDVYPASYESFGELVIYCRRVAGSIGRLCLAIFGSDDRQRASELADDLGVAMQLTNILRDVREDALAGRAYLPKEDLAAHGVDLRLDAAGRLVGSPALDELIRFEAARAEEWYAEGLALLDLLDRRSRACCAAMAGIYHRVLRRIAADPAAVRAGRVALPATQKLAVAARALAGWSV